MKDAQALKIWLYPQKLTIYEGKETLTTTRFPEGLAKALLSLHCSSISSAQPASTPPLLLDVDPQKTPWQKIPFQHQLPGDPP